jgi:dihydrofolate reductase
MIKALFAVDQFGGMGYNGGLPWPHNRADLAHFQKLTMGHVVVMGRRSWDDPALSKPLLGRTVYVATNRSVTAGRISGNIVEEVLKLEKIHSNKIIWIVGGPDILNECRDLYDAIHLTHFKGSYKIDTKIDLKSFLSGFTTEYASVAEDIQSTFIRYEPIFKRTRGSPN